MINNDYEQDVFVIAFGALIGIVMVYLLHKLKGKK